MNLENIKLVAEEFDRLNWNFKSEYINGHEELVSQWLGKPDEDIMVCIYDGNSINEPYHRQDFFFFNYTLKGHYYIYNNSPKKLIAVTPYDIHIAQPFNGYALINKNKEEFIVIGILIKKEVFIKELLPSISSNLNMFKFLLDPSTKNTSNASFHFNFQSKALEAILDLIISAYLSKSNKRIELMKSLAVSFLLIVFDEYNSRSKKAKNRTLIDQLLSYIACNSNNVSLEILASHFGYHPNYISKLIHEKTGKSFKQLLLKEKMERADILLKNTDMSIDSISTMLGYNDTSSFYKAYKKQFGKTPRHIGLSKTKESKL